MRAFTLIEIMIVLILLVAISAVTLPAVFGRLDGRAFETARTQVELAAMLCRADAIRSGQIRELVARETEFGVTELFSAEIRLGNDDEFVGGFGGDFDGGSGGVGGFDEPIRKLLVTLPEGIGIRAIDQSGGDGGEVGDEDMGVFDLPDDVLDEVFGPTPTSDAGELLDEMEIVIAVFLPDGSAQSFAEHRVEQQGGRLASISVGALTGTITTNEIARRAATDPGGFEQDDEYQPLIEPAP